MKLIHATPPIMIALDALVVEAQKSGANLKGIALNTRERHELYKCAGRLSPQGFRFYHADPAQKMGVAGQGIRGMRGYYGTYRILAEEEQ